MGSTKCALLQNPLNAFAIFYYDKRVKRVKNIHALAFKLSILSILG